MNYAQILLLADSFVKRGDFASALNLYTDAQRHLLFKSMLPISDSQVQEMQQKRFMCFRLRSLLPSEQDV
jgi:hypothetical protein